MASDPHLFAAELGAARLAIRQVVSTFTYMGVSVGSHITDDEVDQVAVAVLNAFHDVQNANAPKTAKAAAKPPTKGPSHV
jgi:hypothetical protein